MNSWQTGKLLVVAHDAGGAEVISSWIRNIRGSQSVSYLLEGPAQRIFSCKMPGLSVASEEAILARISKFDRVLVGTSWGTDLEKRIIRLCRQCFIPVAAYLDHWTNYRERFILDGQVVLPDEIWVGDEHAYTLAKNLFGSQAAIRFEENQYLIDAVQRIREKETKVEVSESRKANVLYICEPRTMKYGDPNYWGYTEFEALDEYLSYLTATSAEVTEVIVRLHPSETAGKYLNTMNKHRGNIRLSESAGSKTLDEECAWADWVVGCDSMAMVVALKAGKKVFSCIPQGGRPISLPFPEITRLFTE